MVKYLWCVGLVETGKDQRLSSHMDYTIVSLLWFHNQRGFATKKKKKK